MLKHIPGKSKREGYGTTGNCMHVYIMYLLAKSGIEILISFVKEDLLERMKRLNRAEG